MPPRRLLAAALGAALLAGCPLPGEEGADCLEDPDCNEEEHLGCWEETCHRLSPVDGPLAFEVVPRSSQGLAPGTFFPDATDRVELSLCPPTAVYGTVELPAAHAVEVSARADTGIPGLPLRLTTTLPADPRNQGPRPFALSLPPGSWHLRFDSRDGASPPLTATAELRGCAPGVELDLSPAGKYIREIPLRLGPGPLGHCGASLQGLDPATGEPITARVVARGDGSTCPTPVLAALVDAVDQVLDLVLRVRPAPGGAAVAAQDLPFRSHPGGQGLCPPDVEPPCPEVATVDLLPPDGDEAPYLAPVRVVAETPAGSIAVDEVARVVATGFLDGVPRVCDPLDPSRCGWGQGLSPAVFSTWEEGGGAEVALPLILPGRYGFRVIPTAGSGYAVTSVPPAPVDPAVPVRIPLARKVEATGRVSFENRPLRALVRAEPEDPWGRAASAETGTDGRFLLALDPGRYRLEVRPRDRAAPWGSGELVAEGPRPELDLAVPSRARVRGKVVADGKAVAGALVRAFRCEPDCHAPGATARAVGEAVTAADGSFAMLVPGS